VATVIGSSRLASQFLAIHCDSCRRKRFQDK
jgi:hypothetical protein